MCLNIPQGNGAVIVVRGRESRPHGEGRQLQRFQNQKLLREEDLNGRNATNDGDFEEHQKEFYQKHIAAGTMSATLPYIIFLGLGSLFQEMMIDPKMNGIELTGVLLGKGNPTITINSKTQEIIGQGYAFRPRIEKWNHQLIDSAIFCNPEYAGVSGVLFNSTDLSEEYTNQNTWLFINPYAINKITKKDFRNITYWAADKDMMYRAYRNGRRK